MKQANRPPARATHSHRYGAGPRPKTEKTVVKKIGNGFHDGPPVVTRSKWVISRPHRTQAQGSYVGVEGRSSVTAETARQTQIAGQTGLWRLASRLVGAPSLPPARSG